MYIYSSSSDCSDIYIYIYIFKVIRRTGVLIELASICIIKKSFYLKTHVL